MHKKLEEGTPGTADQGNTPYHMRLYSAIKAAGKEERGTLGVMAFGFSSDHYT